MSVRNRTVRGSVSSEHIVQFFDTDESRAQNAATFLAKGYAAGEPMIVVARRANWAAMVEHLEILGVPVGRAAADGTLVVKDADETLQRFSRGGMPIAALFDATIGEAVTALSARGRVRAYGEMVDMLAQRGDLNEAVTLEGFWNDLSERVPLFLMCGYSAAHFVSTSTHRALLEICKAHSGIHRDIEDPLGDWLLSSAHDAARSTPWARH
jgi:DcmR-like sensory protein